MNIDPNEPAFPVETTTTPNGVIQWGCNGLTVRAELASRFMASYLTQQSVFDNVLDAQIAEYAVQAADALIEELNKPTE